jgi:hypothetical protein
MTPEDRDHFKIRRPVPPDDDPNRCPYPHILDAPYTDDDLMRARYIFPAALARYGVDVPLEVTAMKAAGQVFLMFPNGDNFPARLYIRMGLLKVILSEERKETTEE